MEQNAPNSNAKDQILNQPQEERGKTVPQETTPTAATPNLEKQSGPGRIYYKKLDTTLAKLIINSKLRKFLIYLMLGFVGLVLFILILGAIFRLKKKEPQGYVLNKPKIDIKSPNFQPLSTGKSKSDLEKVIEQTQNLQIPPNNLIPPTIKEKISL